jgi:hypothetical protein
MASLRPVEHLIHSEDPGITLVRSWIAGAKNHAELLPVDRSAGERALVALQVTSRSPLGAIALETGGILIDHGWLRVLGGGHPRLRRAIHEWNGISAGHPVKRLPGAIIVADDAVGGFFALNCGGLSGALGHVFYFPPTSLDWEDVAPSYSDWLVGLLHGDLVSFYEGMRWTGWERLYVEDLPRRPGPV